VIAYRSERGSNKKKKKSRGECEKNSYLPGCIKAELDRILWPNNKKSCEAWVSVEGRREGEGGAPVLLSGKL